MESGKEKKLERDSSAVEIISDRRLIRGAAMRAMYSPDDLHRGQFLSDRG